MAATKTLPTKAEGNKSAAKTVRDLIKYILNEKKTEGGALVYSHNCDDVSFASQVLLEPV